MSGVQVETRRETARAGTAVSVLDRWGHQLQRLPLHLVIIIFIAIWIVPTIGLIVNSFRNVQDMSNAGWWSALFPPHGFSFDSYNQVLQTENVATSIFNSVLITVPATVIQLAIATMGAYAFAWMKFPGKDIFFIVIVGLMVVPIQMTLIPVLQLFHTSPCGSPIRATACRSRFSCCATTWAACRGRSSSRLRWTAPAMPFAS